MQKISILGLRDEFQKNPEEITPEGFVVKREFKDTWDIKEEKNG